MVLMLRMIGQVLYCRRRRRRTWLRRRRRCSEPAADCAFELCPRYPVIAQRLDIPPACIDLGLFRFEQLEDAQEHRVVVLLRLLDDASTQRQDDIALMFGALSRCQHPLLRQPHL